MSVDVASVSYVLSSLASVGKIIESSLALSKRGHPPTPEEYEDLEKRAREESARRVAQGAFMEPGLARSMSQETIENIRKEMDRITKRLQDAIRDPRLSGREKDAVLDIEQAEYCMHLKMIKKLSRGGILPEDLIDGWEDNDCGRF